MTPSDDKSRMLADLEYFEQLYSQSVPAELYANASDMYDLAIRNLGKIADTPDEYLKPRYTTLVNNLLKYLPSSLAEEQSSKGKKQSSRQVLILKDGKIDNMAHKGIITLAIGEKFNKQAVFLAYSCMLHSPSLPRAIITDNPDYFKELYDFIIPYSKDMGDPFKVKLKLPYYSPFYETLFLDSDTLVYTDLHFLWDYFGEQSIVYVGGCRKTGKWYFEEAAEVCKHYHVPWIGGFNSGVLLFRKDEVGLNVFKFAEYIHENHEGLYVPFFRNKMLPDEPFLAVAFGKYNQLPTKDAGRIAYSLVGADSIMLDVVQGVSKFIKDGILVFPAVVHFCGDKKNIYFIEKVALLYYFRHWSIIQNIFTKDI